MNTTFKGKVLNRQSAVSLIRKMQSSLSQSVCTFLYTQTFSKSGPLWMQPMLLPNQCLFSSEYADILLSQIQNNNAGVRFILPTTGQEPPLTSGQQKTLDLTVQF